ncbi:hypothetical protein CBR_g23055 [Chara braunii]|uniref:Uncharacterized protein n=1 Tax=Chara braunii TaxID=69332 RepID=A0A388L3G4_CHABU|nr:hypothetical protein CBR_g23055 [Chara braunii]|eukprot:GBG76840.1 hypothetical protein CBR_g23055 [Chara braunii]
MRGRNSGLKPRRIVGEYSQFGGTNNINWCSQGSCSALGEFAGTLCRPARYFACREPNGEQKRGGCPAALLVGCNERRFEDSFTDCAEGLGEEARVV